MPTIREGFAAGHVLCESPLTVHRWKARLSRPGAGLQGASSGGVFLCEWRYVVLFVVLLIGECVS